MSWLEHRYPPPLVALLTAALMWTAARWRGPATDLAEMRSIIATLIFLTGMAVSVAGFLAFRRAGANVDPVRIDRGEALVTTGVYRYTRNPMYLGLVVALLAWAVWLGDWRLALGPLAFARYVTRFQIFPEERAMSAKFGGPYADYRRDVRRWL